jgi:hypothetical protein
MGKLSFFAYRYHRSSTNLSMFDLVMIDPLLYLLSKNMQTTGQQKVSEFNEHVSHSNKKISRLSARARKVSLIRIFLFLTSVAACIIVLKMRLPMPLFVIAFLFISIFGLLVRKHNKLKGAITLFENIRQINLEEIDRLTFNFDKLPQGLEFANDHHAYSGDLDLYGKNSIFQLLNRAQTAHGISTLTHWLENPADKLTIETRQNAAQELAGMVDWRQKVQAFGKLQKCKSEQESHFWRWLSDPDQISDNRLYRIAPYLLIPATVVLLLSVLFGLIPISTMLVPVTISGILLFQIHKYSRDTYQMTTEGVHLLQSKENILRLIEGAQFNSPYLQGLRNKLFDKAHPASANIMKLRKLLGWLNLRGNQIYHLFNLAFLLDFIILEKVEQWRRDYRELVATWFETIGEFEALGSIAGYSYANEQYIFPSIRANSAGIKARGLGHPLIPPDQRVVNDFSIGSIGEIGLITGSNMAGKSTFLRTIGANAMLAFAGAPVCAKHMELSVFQIFTSMRTKDNLTENVSSFYAELLRLKALLDIINDACATMFLLDELLKGTNSHDRHLGAESLAKQLSKLNAFGLISTHDLQLSELKLASGRLKNYSFSSDIVDGEIIFDYQLHEGVCASTNASQLMANMGIHVDLPK